MIFRDPIGQAFGAGGALAFSLCALKAEPFPATLAFSLSAGIFLGCFIYFLLCGEEHDTAAQEGGDG